MLVLLWACAAEAQDRPPVQDPAAAQTSPADQEQQQLTVLPHDWKHFWLSGQMNFIAQGHPRFHAPYSGDNSLNPKPELALSRVLTLYTGWTPRDGTEFHFDLEETGGHGISDALGLAGFTNLDVVRNPSLGGKPYIARLMLRQVVRLGDEDETNDRGPLSISSNRPKRRLEIVIGKFSLADFLDTNSVGSDSHLQFLNWTIDNNGAWDYAADTRGYTVGAIVELHLPAWSFRFAEALMPEVGNGPHLQWNVRQARGANGEVELRPQLLRDRKTAIRLLAFRNLAHMGNYREANAAFLAHLTPRPDVIATELPGGKGRIKYGFGLNAEQEFTKTIRGFIRLGWNDDKNESFAYTEVKNTATVGGDVDGNGWDRPHDRLGFAFDTNGIGADHRRYLELGGLGFLLGDGRLRYGREDIFESYYTVHLWRGLFVSGDLQRIGHPGYNRDRGPLVAPALRLHVEI
jgi:high affinity Mn2+ porin